MRLAELSTRLRSFFRDVVDPVRERFLFPSRPSDGAISGEPMVLLVGNHSSGKSTFINHLLGAPVQETGMAPTHDDFTVLRFAPGTREIAGEALASNPEFGFGELQAYGTSLLRHVKMRSGPWEELRRLQIVDTPGMIDAADRTSKRAYDFEGVVGWFARRADLVVLFFDPERPGTTAETVEIFSRALAGMEHKIVVVLNKCDLFRRMHDFARCYGTLCWNLGKVLRTKDLPQIHACCVPVEGAQPPALAPREFDAAREAVIERIRRAPSQRADNLLTEAARYVEQLLLHARVVSRVRRAADLHLLKVLAAAAGILLAAAAFVAWKIEAGTFGVAATLSALGALIVAGYVCWFARDFGLRGLAARAEGAGLDAWMEEATREERLRQERRERLDALWAEVRGHTARAVAELGPAKLPRLRGSSRRKLAAFVTEEAPKIRAELHRAAEKAGREAAVPAGAAQS